MEAWARGVLAEREYKTPEPGCHILRPPGPHQALHYTILHYTILYYTTLHYRKRAGCTHRNAPHSIFGSAALPPQDGV